MTRVLLLSGGVDSACVAAWVRPDVCLFVDYGQVGAQAEQRASERIASSLKIRWASIHADCSVIGTGLMAQTEPAGAAPWAEWWPFRNQLLGTLAASWAISNNGRQVLFGTVSGDGARFSDGTGWFFEQLNALTIGQEGAIEIRAPALSLSTEELVRVSGIERGTLGWTFSCHASAIGCGLCPGCRKRAGVFEAVRGEVRR